ncbi:MAG: hypothetical protein WBD40_16815 [Tepidisphaeraceae bacterium]
MFSRRSAGLLLVAGLLIGCQPKAAKEPPPSGEASPQLTASIRERYQRANPKNLVGVVIAVKGDANLAAVGDVPVQEFGIGDVLTFIDTAEQPIATGSVVNATPDALHIRYEVKTRAPRVGDLAVRLPN